MNGGPSWSHEYWNPAVAVGAAIGDDVYVHRHRTSEPFTEVFSTDWSLGDGQDQSCSGNRADPLRAQPDMA